jgi:hypothetical protein
MSLAETSAIAVIELPLYEAELKMFRRAAFLSWISSDIFTGESVAENHNYSFQQGQEDRKNRYNHGSEDSLRCYELTNRSNGKVKLLKRIDQDLEDFEYDSPPSVAAGPVGDDLVCVSIRLEVSRAS